MNIQDRRFRPLLLAALLTLTACGFHLRGAVEMPFQSLYVSKDAPRVVMSDLKRMLASNGVKLTAAPEQAEAQLEFLDETTDKRILSLSGRGKVREYELVYRLNFRTRRTSGEAWGEPQTIESRRDYSYDDTLLLAKEGEEERLFNDMRADAAREILRRLSALQPGGR